MFHRKADGVSANGLKLYATQQDFCRIFNDEKSGLYLLSLLLTADAEKAEQCFVAGLEESTHGNPVFREWARSWSKRVIIKNAIRMIAPTMGTGNGAPRVSSQDTMGFSQELAAVLQLQSLERFVFVMTVLEGYSIQECSILLNRTKQEVARARVRALQSLSGTRPQAAAVAAKNEFRGTHFLQPAQVA